MYLENTREVGLWSKDSDGVVWQWGEKKSILRFLSRFLLGEMPRWHGVSPKRGKHGRGHLVHAIGISVERATIPYPLKVRQK